MKNLFDVTKIDLLNSISFANIPNEGISLIFSEDSNENDYSKEICGIDYENDNDIKIYIGNWEVVNEEAIPYIQSMIDKLDKNENVQLIWDGLALQESR